jgi:hypothetical protein
MFVFADAAHIQEQLNPFASETLPKYAPQALMPQLDVLGNEGWDAATRLTN